MLLIYLYVDAQNQHRWSIKTKNNKVIADSSEGYTSAGMRNKGLGRVIKDLAASQYVLMQAPLTTNEPKQKRKYTKKKRKYTKRNTKQ